MVELFGKNKEERSALTRPPVVRLVYRCSFPQAPGRAVGEGVRPCGEESLYGYFFILEVLSY